MGGEQSRPTRGREEERQGTCDAFEARRIGQLVGEVARKYAQRSDQIAESFEVADWDTAKHFAQLIDHLLGETEEAALTCARRHLRTKGKALELCRDAIHGRLRETREAVAGLRAGGSRAPGWFGRTGRSCRILHLMVIQSREENALMSRAIEPHQWRTALLGMWLEFTRSRELSLHRSLHRSLACGTEPEKPTGYRLLCTGGVGNRGRGWWQLSGPLGLAAAVHMGRPNTTQADIGSPAATNAAVLVYVVDSQNGRIQILDGATMQFVGTLPPDAKEGLTRGQGLLVHPVDLAVHLPTEIWGSEQPKARVAVADVLGNRIVVFLHQPGTEAPTGSTGNVPTNAPIVYRRRDEMIVPGCSHGSTFVAPRAVCFTQTGDVIVADGGYGPRIHCFRLPSKSTETGKILPIWRMGPPCSPDCTLAYGTDTAPMIPAVAAVESLCVSPRNNVLFLCRHDHRRVHILDASNGQYLQTIGLPIPTSVSFSSPMPGSVASPGDSNLSSEGVDGPIAPRLACTPDAGFILVDKTRSALDMYDPQGNHVDSVFAPSPTAAVFGADFNIYVSCAHDHAIRQYAFSFTS